MTFAHVACLLAFFLAAACFEDLIKAIAAHVAGDAPERADPARRIAATRLLEDHRE
ncbi:MAG: hypothetical protein MRY63_04335 [Neomegalonema sp.]|nr:hypothetical protein [Neomegalonema sp.]